jgi:hypothetical protein
VKAGLTEGQSILMSALNLTSAGQFASLSIIAASGAMLNWPFPSSSSICATP